MFKLAQTVAGTWVITVPNPEEAGWETQLVDFNTTAVTAGSAAHEAMERAAALTLATFVEAFPERGFEVQSHNDNARGRMLAMVEEARAIA